MNEVFADTSGWANAFVKTEPYHTEASTLVKQWQQNNRGVVTTNYVLSELITLFIRLRVPRAKGLNYINRTYAKSGNSVYFREIGAVGKPHLPGKCVSPN